MTANRFVRPLLAAAALLLAGATANANDVFVNATISGVVSPGVYGRIDIGNAPPPPVLYAQPMIISQPVGYVAGPPIYLYVPPGHAKHWAKHCAAYNACGRPVYFVNVDNRGRYVRPGGERYEERGYGDDRGGHGHGHGRGHGKGHGRD